MYIGYKAKSESGPMRVVPEQTLRALRRLVVGALVCAVLFGYGVGYMHGINSQDDGCTTDSECMAQCEREGGTDCHLLFKDEGKP